MTLDNSFFFQQTAFYNETMKCRSITKIFGYRNVQKAANVHTSSLADKLCCYVSSETGALHCPYILKRIAKLTTCHGQQIRDRTISDHTISFLGKVSQGACVYLQYTVFLLMYTDPTVSILNKCMRFFQVLEVISMLGW